MSRSTLFLGVFPFIFSGCGNSKPAPQTEAPPPPLSREAKLQILNGESFSFKAGKHSCVLYTNLEQPRFELNFYDPQNEVTVRSKIRLAAPPKNLKAGEKIPLALDFVKPKNSKDSQGFFGVLFDDSNYASEAKRLRGGLGEGPSDIYLSPKEADDAGCVLAGTRTGDHLSGSIQCTKLYFEDPSRPKTAPVIQKNASLQFDCDLFTAPKEAPPADDPSAIARSAAIEKAENMLKEKSKYLIGWNMWDDSTRLDVYGKLLAVIQDSRIQDKAFQKIEVSDSWSDTNTDLQVGIDFRATPEQILEHLSRQPEKSDPAFADLVRDHAEFDHLKSGITLRSGYEIYIGSDIGWRDTLPALRNLDKIIDLAVVKDRFMKSIQLDTRNIGITAEQPGDVLVLNVEQTKEQMLNFISSQPLKGDPSILKGQETAEKIETTRSFLNHKTGVDISFNLGPSEASADQKLHVLNLLDQMFDNKDFDSSGLYSISIGLDFHSVAVYRSSHISCNASDSEIKTAIKTDQEYNKLVTEIKTRSGYDIEFEGSLPVADRLRALRNLAMIADKPGVKGRFMTTISFGKKSLPISAKNPESVLVVDSKESSEGMEKLIEAQPVKDDPVILATRRANRDFQTIIDDIREKTGVLMMVSAGEPLKASLEQQVHVLKVLKKMADNGDFDSSLGSIALGNEFSGLRSNPTIDTGADDAHIEAAVKEAQEYVHLIDETAKQSGYTIEFVDLPMKDRMTALHKLHAMSSKPEIRGRFMKSILLGSENRGISAEDPSSTLFLKANQPAEDMEKLIIAQPVKDDPVILATVKAKGEMQAIENSIHEKTEVSIYSSPSLKANLDQQVRVLKLLEKMADKGDFDSTLSGIHLADDFDVHIKEVAIDAGADDALIEKAVKQGEELSRLAKEITTQTGYSLDMNGGMSPESAISGLRKLREISLKPEIRGRFMKGIFLSDQNIAISVYNPVTELYFKADQTSEEMAKFLSDQPKADDPAIVAEQNKIVEINALVKSIKYKSGIEASTFGDPLKANRDQRIHALKIILEIVSSDAFKGKKYKFIRLSNQTTIDGDVFYIDATLSDDALRDALKTAP